MAGGDGQRTAAQELAGRLRALQQRSGRTLRSLESEVAISDSSLSRYLRGSTVPPWSTVRDLCRALKADPAEYRLLWEAADRAQSASQPDRAAAPAPGIADPATDTARWSRWSRTPRRLLRSRRMCATTGALIGLIVGSALTALVLPPPAPPAPSATSQEPAPRGAQAAAAGQLLVNRATGACLDHSLDEGLRSFKCNALSYQRWTVRRGADDTWQLMNHATGSCLDHGDAGLRAVECRATAVTQKWSYTSTPDHAAELKNTSTGACLDDSGAGLRALPCNRTPSQKWA
ncbi:helix-turn-helix domain-containing protein [Streptomyces sp. NPDC002992]|uniref:helix-turn-helix domain-containing protein n=1 Tax=Streptomyces sp. NPDC002992 TaxID=3154273 RepID=UPI0033AA1638